MRGISMALAMTLVASLPMQPSAQVTVTLDRGERYQTIEGFGACGYSLKPWYELDGPFPTKVDMEAIGFYDSIISELGVTLFRIHSRGDLEQTPGVIDNPGYLSYAYEYIRQLDAAAREQHEPLRFISTSWSPPAWMKVNGEVTCGAAGHPNCVTTDCRLKPDMAPHLADYFVRYVRLLKDSAGIDLHALSIQNEPAFREPHGSCVLCPAEYRDVLKVIGRRFRQEGLATHFFGAEHTSWGLGIFEPAIREDVEARQYMYAWAMHNYKAGEFTQSDTGAYTGPTDTDKPLWMTETGGPLAGLRDWHGGMQQAVRLHFGMRTSRLAAWVWWSLMNVTDGDINTANQTHCLVVNGRPNDKYYVSSHYFRYIRPGARQIKSESSDTSKVKVVAFYHEEHDCMSIVLTNQSAAATTVTLSGANLPATFEMVTSTAETKLQCSTVSSSEAISLPDSSLVTLVAGTYRGTGPVRIDPVQPSLSRVYGTMQAAGAVRGAVLTLDGRRVKTLDMRSTNNTAVDRLPAGIYVRALMDANGRVVSAIRMTVTER